MTDTGQVLGEGQPENAGMVEQPGDPAAGSYAYLGPSESASEDDDLLLMPSSQGAWGDPMPAPPSEPFAPVAHAVPEPAHAAQIPHQHQTVQGGYAPQQPQSPLATYAEPDPHYQARPEAPGPTAYEAEPQFAPAAPVTEGLPHYEAPEPSHPGTHPEQVPVQHVPVQQTEFVAAPETYAAAEAPVEPPAPEQAVAQSAPEPAQEALPDAPQVVAEAPVEPVPVEPVPPEAAAPAPEPGAPGTGSVRVPTATATPTPPPSRRPLHLGPPMPDSTGGVVRSLADRGPTHTPPHPMRVRPQAPPPVSGARYLDVPVEEAAALPGPQLGAIPVPGADPWVSLPPLPETPVEAPAAPVAVTAELGAEAWAEPAPEATVEQAAPGAPEETVVPDPDVAPPPAPEPVLQVAPEPVAEPVAPSPEPAPEPVAEAPVAEEPAVAEAPLAEEPVAQPGPGSVPEPVVVDEAPVVEPAAPVEAEEQREPIAPAPADPATASADPSATAEFEPEPAVAAPAPAPAPEPEAALAEPELEPEPEFEPEPEPVAVVEEPVAAPEPEPAPAAAAQPVAETGPVAAPAPEPAADIEPGPGTEPPLTATDVPAAPAVAVDVSPPAPGYDDAEREAVLRVMRERRDIRKGFRSDPVPHEVLLRVLEAAHTAPSVGHSQPWDFVVIRSAETRQTMHELAQRQRDAYAKSLPKGRAKQFKELKIEAILDTPVNIVVTADPTRGGRHTLGRHTQPQMAPYSSALAVENLWLAARAEGLGVGWVSFFDEREMVRALGLPEHLDVVAYLCVGYVDEFPEEPELAQAGWSKRRPLSWVVHEETYGRRALPGEEPHDLLKETIAGIRPLDAKALGEAWERQKRMTKPAGALGMLEIISAQLSGLSRMCPPPIPEPAAVAVFAGDHGVHAQGVTHWPQEVTAQMVANFLSGGAVCNAFATQVGAEVCVIDVGVAGELPATTGLLPRKVRPGTADFTTGPALTREEVLAAIEVGIETARDLVAAGNKGLLTGEMGIANTTACAALISVYTDLDPAEVTGRGTGINDETLARKVDVVRRGLELHRPDPADPIGVLAAFGGLEQAALVGFLLGGASLRTPVVLDGVSAGAAALVARAIAPEALAACIAGHRSAEPGHVAALNKLGLRPLIDLDLRLGEGTGALLALPVIQSAARAMHEVATFDSAGVTEK
ncbi:nicotinate-nucleotide--dimethylbenzimidazole phosphoribosyltransferase [Streptomyces sp. NBC_01498]|uniref:nicotinate-nucleotide--dimethylbenzimidazole phosphoribosyltransferase n=1 Tax=Streptomyces sp. NBC_01498 TaxID=2975870 RepID=UPI002E7BC192|nr:nicotinate-nucleotide--dimethylbenzimidazole phosphoribosyltransferase [Streptomyces sp. NBC_01498]WTL27803.1 nicotinate-nucleotide--dimethylbenzimidazole phosphoribosyltransferase [Streptomyces sp. NBC_01498]